MVAGCPVVATDVGGVPELVEDGRSGLLIDPGSVTELTDAVETVVRNSSKRKKLSKHAKKRARDFSLDTMIERYRSLYNELLESNSANKQGESHGVE
jgi:glycosyltransferase involved in cell wall biosynthesis